MRVTSAGHGDPWSCRQSDCTATACSVGGAVQVGTGSARHAHQCTRRRCHRFYGRFCKLAQANSSVAVSSSSARGSSFEDPSYIS